MSEEDLNIFVKKMNENIQKRQFWKVMVIDQNYYYSFVYKPLEAIELDIKEGQTTLTLKSKGYVTNIKVDQAKQLDDGVWEIKDKSQKPLSLVFALA